MYEFAPNGTVKKVCDTIFLVIVHICKNSVNAPNGIEGMINMCENIVFAPDGKRSTAGSVNICKRKVVAHTRIKVCGSLFFE